jgi:hypothetical protein
MNSTRRGGQLRRALKDAEREGAPAEGRAAQPRAEVMKGDQYRKFLKDNEQSTKKLMGW